MSSADVWARSRRIRRVLDATTRLAYADADDVMPLGKYFVQILPEVWEHQEEFMFCLWKFPAKRVLRSWPLANHLGPVLGSEANAARFIALGGFYGVWRASVYLDKVTPMADPGWMPPTDCHHGGVIRNEIYISSMRDGCVGVVTHCPDCKLGIRWERDDRDGNMYIRDDQNNFWHVVPHGEGFRLRGVW